MFLRNNVVVNIDHQRSEEATVNEDRALMRFELLEALLRVAVTMRDNEGQEEISPADKVGTNATMCSIWTFCQKKTLSSSTDNLRKCPIFPYDSRKATSLDASFAKGEGLATAANLMNSS